MPTKNILWLQIKEWYEMHDFNETAKNMRDIKRERDPVELGRELVQRTMRGHPKVKVLPEHCLVKE